MQIRIYYEDTDLGGIVYHSNYLKYCERARSEVFFQNNTTPIIDGAHFVVRKMDCDFLSSARFGDIIEVSSNIKEIKKASFILEQEILKDDKIVFKAIVTLVLVKDGKVQRLNQSIKKSLILLWDSRC